MGLHQRRAPSRKVDTSLRQARPQLPAHPLFGNSEAYPSFEADGRGSKVRVLGLKPDLVVAEAEDQRPALGRDFDPWGGVVATAACPPQHIEVGVAAGAWLKSEPLGERLLPTLDDFPAKPRATGAPFASAIE